MTTLPITRMTLYKHGVGYFERQATVEGEKVTLSFRVEEMNDVLKSLTVIDRGEGHVLSMDYATPQSREERLAGNSIRLGDDRSLRDLLTSLRGRRVELSLDQEETLAGTLLGLDELPERQPVADSPVSLLRDDGAQVAKIPFGRIQGVAILDDKAADDLRFFLRTALTQEEVRTVTIRLSPGGHDLTVSYVAPAPTWRVSYRLVADAKAADGPAALLQGWGIFDNRLEEDLEEIELSLVAGMPISFVYELYTPFTPERPEVAEEARVAAGPVDFAGAVQAPEAEAPEPKGAPKSAMMRSMAPAAPAAKRRRAPGREEMKAAAPVSTQGEDLGELFQYKVGVPVSVERGQSAMVPIVAADLEYRKDLLYNGRKFPEHPVASLRLQNESGLTLERGPVLVVEGGEYVGEAILPFTAVSAEFVVPYAVELNIRVQESNGTRREIRALRVSGAYLVIEEWDIRWREYQLNNNAAEAMEVLVEHPRNAQYDLFDTPEPREMSDEHHRFAVEVPAGGEATLRVQMRRLVSRREQLQRQSHKGLRKFARQGLLDEAVYRQITTLLHLWEQIGDQEQHLQQLEEKRQKVYQQQKQIQGNMGSLSTAGKEGQLRAQYVTRLEKTEGRLDEIAQEENQTQAEIKRLQEAVDKLLEELEK